MGILHAMKLGGKCSINSLNILTLMRCSRYVCWDCMFSPETARENSRQIGGSRCRFADNDVRCKYTQTRQKKTNLFLLVLSLSVSVSLSACPRRCCRRAVNCPRPVPAASPHVDGRLSATFWPASCVSSSVLRQSRLLFPLFPSPSPRLHPAKRGDARAR